MRERAREREGEEQNGYGIWIDLELVELVGGQPSCSKASILAITNCKVANEILPAARKSS